MPSIDSIVRSEVRRTMPGSQLYDFDTSQIKVEIEKIEYIGEPKIQSATPKSVDRGELRNCTSLEQKFVMPERVEKRKETFMVSLEGSIETTRKVEGEIGLPKGASIKGETSVTASLTAKTEVTVEKEVEVKFAGQEVKVPSGKHTVAHVMLNHQVVSGKCELHLLITGKVSFSADIDSWLWPDPRMTSIHYQRVVIPATYENVSGFGLTCVENEMTAVCPVGTYCNPGGKQFVCRIGEGKLQRTGPSIGSQLSTTIAISGGPAGVAMGETFEFDPGTASSVVADVTIVEKDTKPHYDDIGKGSLQIPLPNQAGKFSIPVPVRVVTRGGDRIPYSDFLQYIDIEVTEKQ